VPTLTVTGLRRRLGSAEVLAGVDLEVPAGTLSCLVGPSGSGKTTLLKILAGKLDPEGGKVSLDGRDWSFTPPAQRGIAMVMQNYALFPHLSVRENAAFGLEELGVSSAEAARRADEALRWVRVGRALEQPGRGLPAGTPVHAPRAGPGAGADGPLRPP